MFTASHVTAKQLDLLYSAKSKDKDLSMSKSIIIDYCFRKDEYILHAAYVQMVGTLLLLVWHCF